MTFGNRLKSARESKGYKQNQFAEMLGITATRLNYWEKDKREPDVARIKQISALLDVSSDWLIGNTQEINSDSLVLNQFEKQYIKKYRSLDTYGKKTIDTILDIEYERCTYKVTEISSIEIPMSEYRASAGTGNWLDEEYNERVKVADTPQARRANIVIEVAGDSMEPKFHDGDKVLVKIQPDIDLGEIGIFMVDGCGYIKKKGERELISLNSDYPNITIGEYTDYKCFGKVLGFAELVEE